MFDLPALEAAAALVHGVFPPTPQYAWPLLAVASPWGWWIALHPLVVLIFLLYLTGIPHTERRALLSRGDDYRRYQSSTSAFFPWPPRPETKP